jgi:hypothetical protein
MMWSVKEFEQGLSECHPLNRSSLARAGELIYQQMGCSFSQALGKSFRQSIAGLLARKEMNTDKVLEGHFAATVDRCQGSSGEVIVVKQDSTYYNLTSHPAMEGLGRLQGHLKGSIQHNVLASDEAGVPLGLLYQRNWTRAGLNDLENESQKWLLGLEAVNQQLGACPKRVVLLQDREADIFRFFQAQRAAQVDLVVRVYHPRKLEVVASGALLALPEAARQVVPVGTMEVDIERNNKPVKLELQVSAGAVAVLPDKDLSAAKHKVKDLYLVVAREVAAFDKQGNSVFDAQEAACWLLLTSYPIQQAQDALQVVRWYALRWRIERFHYVLKSGGLQVERLQFDDVHTFFNALAFYSIVAWRVLHLTYQGREKGQSPAQDYFDKAEMHLLSAKAKQPVTTLQEAMMALGLLVNFQPTKKQPWPGVKLLAQALVKLYHMKEAIALLYEHPLQD